MAKVSAHGAGEPVAVGYGSVVGRQGAGAGERLCAGLDRDHAQILRAMAAALAGPFQLLYVLHTSRTGARLARYESPEMTLDEVEAFLARFGGFISGDARHDLWVRSHDDDATIVLDRHNLVYAYGPLDDFERVLMSQGLRPGPPPRIDFTHVHHYHPHWDEAEIAILSALPWTVKPLRESDLQRVDAELRLDGVRRLLRSWDPIGVFDGGPNEDAHDEYDSYAPRIVAELQRGSDERRLAELLSRIARDEMGVAPDEGRELSATRRIVQWWSSLPGHD